MSESKAQIFLDKYRDLEYAIRNKYDLENWDSAISYLEKHAEFRNIVNELKYCREVRNLLSHKPKVNEHYCVEPSDEMIHLLEMVERTLEKPPTIMSIAVPVKRILFKSYDNNVIKTLQEMNDHSFGNVPILERGIVRGVVSEKAIVNYIVGEERFRITEDLKLSDIRDYLLMENHHKETYQFVKESALVSEVSDLFHQALNKGYRIGMVFVTKNGRPDEHLMGIVTAWDLAGRK